jgi:hypothetical protein
MNLDKHNDGKPIAATITSCRRDLDRDLKKDMSILLMVFGYMMKTRKAPRARTALIPGYAETED